MRPEDRTRVLHMIEAAEAVAEFVSGRTRADVDADRMLLFAILRAIEVFGEAAGKVSPEAKILATSIPWPQIISMRHRLIHGYFDIIVTLSGIQRPRKSPRYFRRFVNS